MRIVLIAALFAVCVDGFSPLAGQARGVSQLNGRSSTALNAAVAVPNPLKALPWNARKEKEREARRLKMESAKLHREVGIAEDATFEEIQEATELMLARAEGDVKKKIKIEVAKDRIMQIRLNERLAGLTKLTSEAAAQSAAEQGDVSEDVEDLMEKAGEWKPPQLFTGLIKKPSDEYKQKQIKQWGLLSLVCLVLPPVGSQLGYINWIIAGVQIMNRGAPEMEPYGEMEGGASPKKKKTQSFLIALGIWFTTKVLFGTLAQVFPSLVVNKMAQSMETLWINVFLATATLYIQTYKE
eukprot:CAMPEP_0113542346 /NCGR_PEP_ID=MMETSP0015_2-20120614/9554_1 /TAXON_ID=2838 /ORGANISM="Odontella" /LENGTH=296 /DNA_ID=CAMNT_0000442389 /DNA_START=143 /DNA_END=1033 /DNA_ORIENTATION=+ /assembly_acc=CAM_ASM_000160